MTGKEQILAGYHGKKSLTNGKRELAGFKGRGGGNPRHKPHLESHHNLVHNESGDLPAQTGHDRHFPEWLHGLTAITEEVLDYLTTLPRERAALLIAPMCEYWQALGILAEIDQRIAFRTDHNLEGWQKCGHVVTEYRRDPSSNLWIPPSDFLTLPEGDRTLIQYAAEASPLFRRTRKLSPREVFGPASRDFIRFPDHVIALMFCDDQLGMDLRSEPKRLGDDGRFHVNNQLADPEPLAFEGHVTTPHGEPLRLAEGVSYRTVLNPFDATALWIYDLRGGFVGTAALVQRFCQLDAPAVQKALAHWNHEKAALFTPLKDRHAGVAAEIRALQEHNAQVAKGEAMTEVEIADERAAKRLAQKAILFGKAAKEKPETGNQKPEGREPLSTSEIECWDDLPATNNEPQTEIESW